MTRARLNVLASIVLLALYALSIGYLGFFVSTFAYLIAHMLLLGIRGPKHLLLVSSGTVLVFYIAVEWFLNVSLPHGVLY